MNFLVIQDKSGKEYIPSSQIESIFFKTDGTTMIRMFNQQYILPLDSTVFLDDGKALNTDLLCRERGE